MQNNKHIENKQLSNLMNNSEKVQNENINNIKGDDYKIGSGQSFLKNLGSADTKINKEKKDAIKKNSIDDTQVKDLLKAMLLNFNKDAFIDGTDVFLNQIATKKISTMQKELHLMVNKLSALGAILEQVDDSKLMDSYNEFFNNCNNLKLSLEGKHSTGSIMRKIVVAEQVPQKENQQIEKNRERSPEEKIEKIQEKKIEKSRERSPSFEEIKEQSPKKEEKKIEKSRERSPSFEEIKEQSPKKQEKKIEKVRENSSQQNNQSLVNQIEQARSIVEHQMDENITAQQKEQLNQKTEALNLLKNKAAKLEKKMNQHIEYMEKINEAEKTDHPKEKNFLINIDIDQKKYPIELRQDGSVKVYQLKSKVQEKINKNLDKQETLVNALKELNVK